MFHLFLFSEREQQPLRSSIQIESLRNIITTYRSKLTQLKDKQASFVSQLKGISDSLYVVQYSENPCNKEVYDRLCAIWQEFRSNIRRINGLTETEKQALAFFEISTASETSQSDAHHTPTTFVLRQWIEQLEREKGDFTDQLSNLLQLIRTELKSLVTLLRRERLQSEQITGCTSPKISGFLDVVEADWQKIDNEIEDAVVILYMAITDFLSVQDSLLDRASGTTHGQFQDKRE